MENTLPVNKDIYIEDLIELYPEAVTYLMKQGIRCLVCGEPIWGTLESAAKEKGFNDSEIGVFVSELNILAQK